MEVNKTVFGQLADTSKNVSLGLVYQLLVYNTSVYSDHLMKHFNYIQEGMVAILNRQLQ